MLQMKIVPKRLEQLDLSSVRVCQNLNRLPVSLIFPFFSLLTKSSIASDFVLALQMHEISIRPESSSSFSFPRFVVHIYLL